MWWRRNDDKKQLNAFFDWVNTIVSPNDVIFVDLPRIAGYFYFEFPLRYGDKPKKAKNLPPDKKITFLIRNPDRTAVAIDDSWIKIFSSPTIEIFENKSRVSGDAPLRWGLTAEEKINALNSARKTLDHFLKTGGVLPHNEFHNPSPRFRSKIDVGVALWTRGEIRGSFVIEGYELSSGIQRAAIAAAQDPRFKPLEADELDRTRIEITLMHDLRLPITKKDKKRGVIFPEKGYLLKKGNRRGWFLPEVFNVLYFKNLDEFLKRLAAEKAGIVGSRHKNADIFIFEVDDFIESRDKIRPLILNGPLVEKRLKFTKTNLEAWFKSIAEWLVSAQEPSGNIPPIVSSRACRTTKQTDWPRLAFTAWTLAEFGKTTREKRYIDAAEKSFFYIKNSGHEHHALTLAYAAELAMTLGHENDAFTLAEKIIKKLPSLNFEPIMFAQIATLFKATKKTAPQFEAPFKNLASILKKQFESALCGSNPFSLAAWAELINTFHEVDLSFSKRMAEWLKNYQLPAGAFPNLTKELHGDALPNLALGYARGTGKIFEVLALDPDKNRAAIEKALTWLNIMHYDEENTFFIPEEVRYKFLGALRHDYFNREAWSDAAGHMLLGGSRLITKI